MEPCEAFRGEARQFCEASVRLFREGVADGDGKIADDADDVACEGFVDGLAVATEEPLGIGEPDLLTGAGIDDLHVALEGARDDAEEEDAVAVAGVHVCLDLEDEG
jgi:hypothetical protein